MDISVLSCTNGQQTVEEEEVVKETMVDEKKEEKKMESEERKNGEGKDMRLRRQSTTGRPRGRPRQLDSPQKRSIRTRVSVSGSCPQHYLTANYMERTF